jgi:predicted dehydrogenase
MSLSDDGGRRRFLSALGTGAAALLTGGRTAEAQAPAGATTSKRRRYAIVGTGQRGTFMWGQEVHKGYGDIVEFAGLCDVNPKRAETSRKLIGVNCPVFTSFEEMLDKAKPDLVGVMTVDAFHADYIVKALDRGIDVITEKPMVIDEQQCQAVLDAEKRSGRNIKVTFNYRYAPRARRIKEILMSGQLGKVEQVAFDWYLNTTHGADYFRRWHRLQSKSGSLFVHKATHHFDLINWWLDSDPVEVMAYGRVAQYGKNGPFRHSHCRPCPHQSKCNYYWDMTRSPMLMQLYAQNEVIDGYRRDGCVYREDVDTFDTMSAVVKYASGASMSYSLNAFMPFEGFSVTFTCEKGTLVANLAEKIPGGDRMELVVRKNFSKTPPVIERPPAEEGHGGGDQRLRDAIFRPELGARAKTPPHMALPGSRAGAMSCLTGIAARKSVQLGRAVKIADLVKL